MRPWRGRVWRSSPSRSAQRVQDRGGGRRVQAVAAVVDPQAGDLERPGHPADRARPLEHDDLVPGRRGPPGGREARGPRSDDRDHAEVETGSAGFEVTPLPPAAASGRTSAASASASAA